MSGLEDKSGIFGETCISQPPSPSFQRLPLLATLQQMPIIGNSILDFRIQSETGDIGEDCEKGEEEELLG